MSRVYRGDRRWKNRALIRERDAQRARRLWVTLALVALALEPAGIYLYEQNTCLQLGYEIESIEKQRADLAEMERRLAVDHARRTSMQSIERWAERKRLTRPQADDIVIVPHALVENETVLAQVPERATEPAPGARRFE